MNFQDLSNIADTVNKHKRTWAGGMGKLLGACVLQTSVLVLPRSAAGECFLSG